jgi:hypothetical protein
MLLESLSPVEMPPFTGVPGIPPAVLPVVVPRPTMIPSRFPMPIEAPVNPEESIIRRGVFWSLESPEGQSLLGWPEPHDVTVSDYNSSSAFGVAQLYMVEELSQSNVSPAVKQRLKRKWERLTRHRMTVDDYCRVMNFQRKAGDAGAPARRLNSKGFQAFGASPGLGPEVDYLVKTLPCGGFDG